MLLTAALVMGSTASIARAATCGTKDLPTICSIKNGYDPAPSSSYTTQCARRTAAGLSGRPPVAKAISDAINWAAGRGVPKFIDDVCGLTNIFMDPDNATPHSWGKW